MGAPCSSTLSSISTGLSACSLPLRPIETNRLLPDADEQYHMVKQVHLHRLWFLKSICTHSRLNPNTFFFGFQITVHVYDKHMIFDKANVSHLTTLRSAEGITEPFHFLLGEEAQGFAEDYLLKCDITGNNTVSPCSSSLV